MLTVRDVRALQDELTQLRAWLDRLEHTLEIALRQAVPAQEIASTALAFRESAPSRAVGAEVTLSCETGHVRVEYSGSRCPVCAITLRAGYSEKWCQTCGRVTAHVGGVHVHANCLTCLSDRLRRALRTPDMGSMHSGQI